MKKFLSLAILILLSVTARAQYIDGVPQSLERRAGHLYTDDGTRLSQAAAMSLLSEDMYGMYSSGRHLYKAGVIVCSIGGVLEAAGITILAITITQLNSSKTPAPLFAGMVLCAPFVVIEPMPGSKKQRKDTLPGRHTSRSCPLGRSQAASG